MTPTALLRMAKKLLMPPVSRVFVSKVPTEFTNSPNSAPIALFIEFAVSANAPGRPIILSKKAPTPGLPDTSKRAFAISPAKRPMIIKLSAILSNFVSKLLAPFSPSLNIPSLLPASANALSFSIAPPKAVIIFRPASSAPLPSSKKAPKVVFRTPPIVAAFSPAVSNIPPSSPVASFALRVSVQPSVVNFTHSLNLVISGPAASKIIINASARFTPAAPRFEITPTLFPRILSILFILSAEVMVLAKSSATLPKARPVSSSAGISLGNNLSTKVSIDVCSRGNNILPAAALSS